MEEAAMFRRVGVFAGSFDLAASATVGGTGELSTASDLIGRLADKSLLVRASDAVDSRWSMLETVRAFAHEQLASSGEESEIRHRHLMWAVATAKGIEESIDDGR